MHRRLRSSRYLHDRSDCYRLERQWPGGPISHREIAPFHGAHTVELEDGFFSFHDLPRSAVAFGATEHNEAALNSAKLTRDSRGIHDTDRAPAATGTGAALPGLRPVRRAGHQ